jgi:hypothetical protein
VFNITYGIYENETDPQVLLIFELEEGDIMDLYEEIEKIRFISGSENLFIFNETEL